MEKYIRKIIHFEILNQKYFDKTTVAYCKLEKRKNKNKILIMINGIKELENIPYIFSIVYKEGEKYFIKELKNLKIINNAIKEEIQIESELLNKINSLVVMIGPRDRASYEKKIILIGYQESKYNLNELNDEGSIQRKEKPEGKEKKTTIEVSTEILTELSTETSKETSIETETSTETSTETLEKPLEKESEEELKKGSNKIRDEIRKEPETKKQTNTLEYIKERLEKNEEISVIDQLFENNQEFKPFANYDQNTKWIKIKVTDLLFLPLESWLLMNNSFIIKNYNKYKHLILGKSEEEGTLSLGIPDIYYFRDSIIANICGFEEFTPCCGGNIKSGEYGYWIIKTTL